MSTAGAFALLGGFVIALGGVAASIFYSNMANFLPCTLCWWQRIFLYPQVLILGIAFMRRDARAWIYSMALSICGAAIALYHTYLQFGGSPLVPCGADAAASQCAQRYFLEFGYVTIPTMALTAFIVIIVLMVAHRMTHITE